MLQAVSDDKQNEFVGLNRSDSERQRGTERFVRVSIRN